MKNKKQRKMKKYVSHECQIHKVQPFISIGTVFKKNLIRPHSFEFR